MEYVLEILRTGERHKAPEGIVQYLALMARASPRAFAIDWDALNPLLEALEAGRATAENRQRLGNLLRAYLNQAEWSLRAADFLRAARDGTDRVDLVIRSTADEIYTLPWELLTIEPTDQHLGERHNVLVRYAFPDVTSAARGAPGRRVLMAWSAAGGRVPADPHIEALCRAAQGSRRVFDRARDVLSDVSVGELVARLDGHDGEPPVAILHLLCHGVVDDQSVSLSFSSGLRDELLDASWLRRIMSEHAGHVRLVVLSACHGGDPGAPGSHLGSVAQALHKIGIEHVIAWRYALSKRSSVIFTEVFYQHLLGQGHSVEQAFLAARRELARSAGTFDWAALQLYSAPGAPPPERQQAGHSTPEPERPLVRSTIWRPEPRGPAGSTLARPAPGRRAGTAVSPLALELDRTEQWGPLKEVSAGSEKPAAILVHGDAGQDVHLFCARIQRHFDKGCKQRAHRVFRLPFREEYSTASTVEDWEERLRSKLDFTHLGNPLTRATSEHALMLILGNGPLRDLNADETDALTAFLGDRLPKLVHAAQCRNPVRVLVPIEHRGRADGLDDPLVQAVYGALLHAAKAGFHTEFLIELTFPKWAEVTAYILNKVFVQPHDPDIEFLKQCHQVYQQFEKSSERSFVALAGALHELIEEWSRTMSARR